jgi:hypothetical protein
MWERLSVIAQGSRSTRLPAVTWQMSEMEALSGLKGQGIIHTLDLIKVLTFG